jgi:hypothetical protein
MKRFRSFLSRKTSQSADQGAQQANAHPPPAEPQPQAPPPEAQPSPDGDFSVQATSNTLNIALINQFPAGSTVYAVVSGRAISNNNALVLLRSDGRTPYYPTSPSGPGSAVNPNDVAIRLGATGSTTNLTIPYIAGGRIYFSLNEPLKFFINPGPALVEPAVANPSDPNIAINWGFCEFTFNQDQLYANISYVDFVSSIPIALSLSTVSSNPPPAVQGLKPGGLNGIAEALRAQRQADGQAWDQLIVPGPNNSALRVLSPNIARVTNNSLFNGYFEPYVSQVWSHYSGSSVLKIDTQAQWGVVTADIANDALAVSEGSNGGSQKPIGGGSGTTFTRPSTADIFSCSTGPFATGSNALTNTVIPRLAAAFNRSTLLKTDQLPAPQNTYYQEAVTNHYSRVVHEWNYDGRGYAFPYDDVQPSGGGLEQSGEVHAGDPRVWTVTVGGGS